jgi:16S rRNA (adenine1518-N6/adenine1519-N6)-dimethyltransferase
MKLSEMRQILTDNAIQLTKSLGQNFLHDGNQLRRIVAAADLKPDDQVLEIGPGLGPLTELLLATGARVFAIEKDQRLFQFLQQRFADNPNLTLRHDDALAYLQHHQSDWAGWKLVANLPYSVASPILVELAQALHCPQRLVVTLQLEVAHRIVAKADDADYGLLSLLIQLNYEPVAILKIPASCFYPPPDVDSACVHLELRSTPMVQRELQSAFTKIVKRSFSQRRKMMFKLLKADWPEPSLSAAFAVVNLSPKVRAEAVTLEQFAELTRLLSSGKV